MLTGSDLCLPDVSVMIKKRPQDSKIEEYEPPITLSCDHVISIPTPSITWYKVDCACDTGSASNDATPTGTCEDCYVTNYRPNRECLKQCVESRVTFNDSITLDKYGIASRSQFSDFLLYIPNETDCYTNRP